MIDMWEFENRYLSEGYKMVCGVDEAGRGPLAGPVCAAAVILPLNIDIPGLNYRKKLSDKKRRELFPVICEKAVAYDHTHISSKFDDIANALNNIVVSRQV